MRRVEARGQQSGERFQGESTPSHTGWQADRIAGNVRHKNHRMQISVKPSLREKKL